MRRHGVLKIFFLFLFLSICSMSFPGFSIAQTVISLNYSNFFPAPHPHSLLAEQWCREIEKRTNGRVKIAYFPGGTLTPAAQIYDGVVKGISDIGFSCFSYTRGKFPLTEVIDLPIGVKDGIIATHLINEYYKKFKPKEIDEMKVMYLHAHGPGMLHTRNKPVYKLEDLKGMKIRATGLSSKIVTALGGTPVGTTQSETYDVLRTGVVDGAFSPFEALQGFKWGEVIKFSTVAYGSGYSTGMFIAMNKNKWNSLPPDIQKVFNEVNEEWIEKQGRVWVEIENKGIEFTKNKGNQIIYLSKEEDARWAAAVKPIQDDYLKSTKAKSLPGEEALKFCLDYLKTHQK